MLHLRERVAEDIAQAVAGAPGPQLHLEKGRNSR